MKKLFLFAVLFIAAAFLSCSKHDNEINDVEPPVPPETTPLAIAFAEGNSLQFDVDETKIVHYTITGGSDNTVVTAELQTADDAYTVKTTPTSATEGTITITAKTPETENCVIVTVSDGDRSITAEIAVSTNAIPEKDKLAITFAEGNSLEFDVNETKTVHYTITGGSEKTVVTAELQTADDAYTVKTTPTSATEGTITITAKMPETENCVIVTVSDGSQTVTAEIAVSTKHITIMVETPGTLAQLLADYDKTTITKLTVIGNLNDKDIAALTKLPNLAVLDMENANLEVLPFQTFYGKKSLTSVKLPKTLKTIGAAAFYGCYSLTSITIPDSVTTIGSGAFSSCSGLTSVTIPDSVTTIGENTFQSCRSLTSVTIPDSVTSIGSHAFDYCTSLTSITIPDSVTSIGDWAFVYCNNLTSVTIPDGVTTIGENTFRDCSSLTSVTIPDSVTTIGNNAFYDCYHLTSVTIPDSVTTIGDGAFHYCTSLTSVTIPEGVTAIGAAAFWKCNNLTSVYITDMAKWCAIKFCGLAANPLYHAQNLYLNGKLVTELVIPDSVTKIGYSAFFGCSSLTSVTIPDSVTSIGSYAFTDCRSLTSVTIGNSVTTIGGNAFYYCSSLTSIYCKAQTPPTIENNTFPNLKMCTLYVPTGCKEVYAAAEYWKEAKAITEMKF